MYSTITTLCVLREQNIELIWASGGIKGIRNTVYEVLVGRTRDVHKSLYSLKKLSSTQNLTIEVLEDGWILQDIALPEWIYEWIIRYLQNSNNILNNTDCLGFIVEVLWWRRWDRMVDDGLFSYHGVELIYNIQSLSPGDVISMSDGTEEWWRNCRFHYALYLGRDLFLQKLGKPWVLAISNFEQMKKLYPELRLTVKLLLKRIK